jgi:hypothetical protein
MQAYWLKSTLARPNGLELGIPTRIFEYSISGHIRPFFNYSIFVIIFNELDKAVLSSKFI